jgi:hypothetical protein
VKGNTENSFTAIPHGNIGATRTCRYKNTSRQRSRKGLLFVFHLEIGGIHNKEKIEQQASNIKNMVVLNEYVHGICEIGVWTIFFMK